MNRPQAASRPALSSRPTIGFLGAILFVGLFASAAQAVTITVSTYASRSAPGPAVATTGPLTLSNPTTITDSISSSVLYSHAQAAATATIGAMGVTKSTSGRAWEDVSPTLSSPYGDPRYFTWSASASGTQLVVNGPSGQTENLHFVIPANGVGGLQTLDSNPPPGSPSIPSPMQVPTNNQGLFFNGIDGNPAIPAFADLTVTITAMAQQGSTNVSLFNGSFTLNPNSLAGASMVTVAGTGDFQGQTLSVTHNDQVMSPNLPQYSVVFPTNIFGTKEVQETVGVPFDTSFTVSMSMADPSNPDPMGNPTPVDFSSFIGGQVGGGGTVTAQFLLDNPDEFSLAAVPEPSSWLLAAIGGLGIALAARRRRALAK